MEIQTELKDQFDIVLICCDNDQSSFDEYLKEMPWKSLPFSGMLLENKFNKRCFHLDRHRSKLLNEKLNVKSLPTLVVISSSCEIINTNCVISKESIHKYCSRERREEKYIWENIVCSGCEMNPLIGSRYGCTHRDCDTDFCERCFLINDHHHPLVKYLVPGKSYSVEQMFEIVPHLVQPNDEETIPTKTMLEDDVKAVGFYFCADWCPTHRALTPKLTQFYKEIQGNSSGFRLVFVSCDRDEKSFNDYHSMMSWPAVPFNCGNLLKSYFQVSGK